MKFPVRLTRKLVLEAPETAPDGAGGLEVNWVSLGTLWANVQARSSREDFIAGQPLPKVKYRIQLRSAPIGAERRPVAGQRLRDGVRSYSVLAVAEHDINGRYLEILAEEDATS